MTLLFRKNEKSYFNINKTIQSKSLFFFDLSILLHLFTFSPAGRGPLTEKRLHIPLGKQM